MENELAAYREHINECDHMLMHLLHSRMRVCELIGTYKKKEDMDIWQPDRYQQLRERWVKEAEKEGLNATFAEKLFEIIHAESIRLQQKV